MAKSDDSMKVAPNPEPKNEPSHMIDAMQAALGVGDERTALRVRDQYRRWMERNAQQIGIAPISRNIVKPFMYQIGTFEAVAPSPSLEDYQRHLESLAKVVEWFRAHKALDPLEGQAGEMLERVIRQAIGKTYKDFNP